MSMSVGPGDLVMLVKGLWKLANILQHEAKDSFRRCAKTYQRFAGLASTLNELIDNDAGLRQNEFLNTTRQDIEQMLRSYFKKIREFRPYLGRRRVHKMLFCAIAKLRWVRHSDMLEELRRDLEFRFAMLSPLVAMLSPHHAIRILDGIPTVPRNVPRGNFFVLEDARRVFRPVFFSDTPDWNHFHQLLSEQIFPKQGPGHSVINSKSYVLRKVSTSQDILPGSPSLKLFRDVLNPDDRVEMSVIVPYEDEDTDLCPGCGTERGAGSSSSIETSCLRCGLSVRFYDSFDDQPDPLTQLALDDLRGPGLRKFVSEFFTDLEEISPSTSGKQDSELKSIIRPRVLDAEELEELEDPLWFLSPRPAPRWFLSPRPAPRGAIKHFRRIALCTPRWPSIEMHSKNETAKRQLRIAIKGTQLLLDRLRKGPELAPGIVGRAIGSRDGGRTERIEELLESLLSQYRSRIGQSQFFRRAIHVLDIYQQCAQESRYPFRTSVLRVRCLLWIFSQVLTLETKILSGCSSALMVFAREGYVRREKPSLLEKAMSCLFIPRVLMHRATIDVIADTFSLFGTCKPPPPLLGAIFFILQNSRGLCLDYLLDGNLQSRKLDLPPSNVFNQGALASREARSSWQISCRQCLESVMSSGGADLAVPSAGPSLVAWFHYVRNK